MTYRLKSETVSVNTFKLRTDFLNLLRNFFPYILDICIKMAEKGPLMERMNTFERKQHYNVTCTAHFQGIS